MRPELRQRHRRIWQLWAILLPVGFIAAILVLPQKSIQPALYGKTAPISGKATQTIETEWLTVRLYVADAASQQLEIVLRKPLEIPSTQVFWGDTFLGSLGPQGTYRFPLDAAMPHSVLEIRDPVNQTVFQQISFEQ